jgi:hypothetical protein
MSLAPPPDFEFGLCDFINEASESDLWCDSLEFEAFDEEEFGQDDFGLEQLLSDETEVRSCCKRTDDGANFEAECPRSKRIKAVNEDVYMEYSADGTFKMRKGTKLKGQWTTAEDSQLAELVQRYGTRRWSQIARVLNGRVGKQCRERWNNHLAPDIKRGSWTEEEEATLIRAHREVGNKWSDIARQLKGRTENSVKNHWNATKRRKDNATSTPFRDYVNEYMHRQQTGSLDSSQPDTASDSNHFTWLQLPPQPSPRDSTIKKKGDAVFSNISTQESFETSRLRSSLAAQGDLELIENSIIVNMKRVPELHAPIVIKLPGNTHDSLEILNCHEQLTQDREHSADCAKNCEVASYASTIPLPPLLLRDISDTLKGLVSAVRYHCPVISLSLSVKSGSDEILKRFGGNCFMLSVSARRWEDAMQGVRLGVGYIKSVSNKKA